MTITVNEQSHSWPEQSLTVREILARLNFSFPLIVVRLDGQLVPKSDYDSVAVPDGARMEAIHLISGG